MIQPREERKVQEGIHQEEICDMNEEEGEEILSKVNIPVESIAMNLKNSDLMLRKDMSEP